MHTMINERLAEDRHRETQIKARQAVYARAITRSRRADRVQREARRATERAHAAGVMVRP